MPERGTVLKYYYSRIMPVA